MIRVTRGTWNDDGSDHVQDTWKGDSSDGLDRAAYLFGNDVSRIAESRTFSKMRVEFTSWYIEIERINPM